MKSQKFLLLQFVDYGIFPFNEKNEKIYVRQLFKNNNNLIDKIFRKGIFYFNLPFCKKIFSHWLDIAKSVDTIIIFDNNYAPFVVHYLHRLFPKKRLIVWYWNIVATTVSPNKFDRRSVELWSFDKQDCEKYSLKYNTQFYFKEYIKINNFQKSEYDIVYLGVLKNKDRLKKLRAIEKEFQHENLKFKFFLVKGKEQFRGVKYSSKMKYSEILKIISKSKCIVDITNLDQVGLSLRPLEALFLRKKLITDNKKIVEEPLFNKNNIFIFNNSNSKDINCFIREPYDVEKNKKLIEYYSFEEWLERFNRHN